MPERCVSGAPAAAASCGPVDVSSAGLEVRAPMCENEDTDAPHRASTAGQQPSHKVDTKLYKTPTPSQGGSIKPRSSTQRRVPRRARAKESSQRRRQTASTRGGLAGASSVCARETSD